MTTGPFLNDINQNSPPTTEQTLVRTEYIDSSDDLAWVIDQLAATNPHIRDHALAMSYYEGHHRIVLDTAEHQAAFSSFLSGLRVNVCPAVVDALTDRLKVKGFTAPTGTPKAIAERAGQLWEELGLARTANRVHSEAVSTGDAFLLVWPDVDGVPRCYPHTSLEMCHAHDAERPEIITKAGKLWRDGKRYRITLYYSDRIEKYITRKDVEVGSMLKADAFIPLDSPEPWPLPNDYGKVPVFHFPYNANSHGHGISALRDVIPIQDSINHTMINRAVTIDFAAYPMRVFIGVEADVDEYGRPLTPIRSGIDKIQTLANPDAKVAQFDAASMVPFHDALSTDLNMITVITGIPPHHFQTGGGDFPSGEALKTSESRLVNRVVDTQIDLGGEWGQVLSFVVTIADGIADARLLTEWYDAETRSENDEVTRSATKVERIGVPESKVWEELGYTDIEIAAMKAEKEAAAAVAAEQFTQAFDRGEVGSDAEAAADDQ
jgi:hypothetical protein